MSFVSHIAALLPLLAGPLAAAVTPANFTVFPCNAADCSVAQVAADSAGNTYAVGSRYFTQTGGVVAVQTSDVYVVKLDPAGNTVFLTTLGGSDSDQGLAIALDPAGEIFVAGSANSHDFPLRNPVQSKIGSSPTGFVAKLSADGSQILYSTYFGGTTSSSSVNGIAADAAGNAYLTGYTGSSDYPTTAGLPAASVSGLGPGGVVGAFFAKLSPAGAIVYSGLIAGGSLACSGGSSCFLSIRGTTGSAIGVDAAGDAMFAGNANVTDLPTTLGALLAKGLGAWVARVNASGTKLDYLTYLSSATYGIGTAVSASTYVDALAVDTAGNAYLTGSTSDPGFITTKGAFQTTFDGSSAPPGAAPADAYVLKLSPQGAAAYSTYFGGSGSDIGAAIALDSAGAVYISGRTTSTDLPLTTGAQIGSDFIAALNPAGSGMTYSARYPGGSVSQGLAHVGAGQVTAANAGGIVSSVPLIAGEATQFFGVSDAAGGSLSAEVAPGEVISLYGVDLGPASGLAAQAVSGVMPLTLAGVQVLFDGTAAPLLYVSGTQINAVAPFGLKPGVKTTIDVVTATTGTSDFIATITASRPTIFGYNGAAAINQDGTLNSAANPAKVGSIVSVWATGAGAVSPLPADGAIATGALDYRCCGITIFGQPAPVLYAGAAPGIVDGVVQINFRVAINSTVTATQQATIGITVAGSMGTAQTASTWIYVTP